MKRLILNTIITLSCLGSFAQSTQQGNNAFYLDTLYVFVDDTSGTCFTWPLFDTTRTYTIEGLVFNQTINTTLYDNASQVLTYCISPLGVGSITVDSFQYEACTTPISCDTINVIIIIDTTRIRSVWPGDVNTDGIVNNYDLLSLGYAFGNQGSSRPSGISNAYIAQFSFDWPDTIPSGINMKHSDCDGSGRVFYKDTIAIIQNYGLTHQKGGSQNGTRFVDPSLFVQFNQGILSAADTLTVLVNLGTQQLPATDVYGVAFSLTYNPLLMDTGNIRMNFNGSWLLDSVPNGVPSGISISVNQPLENKLDIALSRINQVAKTGFGQIGRVDVVIEDNIDGKRILPAEFIMNITDARVVDANGVEIPVFIFGDTALTDIETGIATSPEQKIIFYPNPVSTTLHLGFTINTEIAIWKTNGKLLLEEKLTGNQVRALNVSDWANGIYFIRAINEQGIIMKKFIKQNAKH